MLVTTIIIGFFYGLLPDDLRFSRALLVLGALGGTAALLFYRACIALLTGQRFLSSEQLQPRLMYYGAATNVEALHRILDQSGVRPNFLWEQEPLESEHRFQRLKTLLQLHKINELIVDSNTVSYDELIALCEHAGSFTSIKSLLPKQGFIIGSDSSLSQGTTYKKQYQLSNAAYIRQRRVYEVGLTLLVMALLPACLLVALLWGRGYGLNLWAQNAYSIIVGKRSLIGYNVNLCVKFSLPKLPQPIFDICRDLPEELDYVQNARALTEDYAKEASVRRDLLHLWQLSKRPVL